MSRRGLQGNIATAIALGTTAGALDLERVAWEGGPSYYTVAQTGEQMTLAEAAGWSDDTWFPIGVWLGSNDSGHAATYQSAGINVYAAMTHTPATITNATNLGLHVLCQANEWSSVEVGSNPLMVGWLPLDEPDLFSNWADYQTAVAAIRAKDDGRFAWTNWSVGPLDIGFFDSQTPAGMALVDANCIDQYAYTSPSVREHFHHYNGSDAAPGWPGPPGDDDYAEKAASYGWLTDRMQDNMLEGGGLSPSWIFIETKMPYLGVTESPDPSSEAGKDIILYAEIEGAVWSAIIHECRGIMYFDYNGFYNADAPAIDPNTGIAPDTGNLGLIDCEVALRTYVTAINGRITALAPVLNTQSYVFNFGAGGIDTMLKAKDGNAYIFAGVGLGGTTGSKTFTLTGTGITGTTVTVLNEARTVNVSGGQFTDSFANEYTHHIYRIQI